MESEAGTVASGGELVIVEVCVMMTVTVEMRLVMVMLARY